MRSKLRLTSTLLLDNALPSWVTPNDQDGFLPLGFSVFESRILPLAILLPIKLISYILTVRLRFYRADFQPEPSTSGMLKKLFLIIQQFFSKINEKSRRERRGFKPKNFGNTPA